MSGRVIEPHPGPQTAFLSSRADICVYGGAAGGGKTLALLVDPLRWVHIAKFGAVIFRRTYPQIRVEGGMWDESMEIYPHCGGEPREHTLEWRFGSGARIKFGQLQHEHTKYEYKGAQIAVIGFDQLEEFSAGQFWYLLSRNRSTSGVKPYVRATCNPDASSWVKNLLGPWVDPEHPEYRAEPGELRYVTRDGDEVVFVGPDWRDEDGEPAKSLTFIPATIYDNPSLLGKDRSYLASLRALPFVERRRLLDGDWSVLAEGNLFRRQWFTVAEEVPAPERYEELVRSWDLAGTTATGSNDPDWTVGALVGLSEGVWYVLEVLRVRETAREVDRLMLQTAAADGQRVEILLQQDPGEAGKRAVEYFRRLLAGFVVSSSRPTGDKVVRARPLASAAEAGNVVLARGGWNREFIAECVAFPGGGHDDQVDAVSWALANIARPRGMVGAIGIPPGTKFMGSMSRGSGGGSVGRNASRYPPRRRR